MRITNDMKKFLEKQKTKNITLIPVSGWPRFYGSRRKNRPHQKVSKRSSPLPPYVRAAHVGWRMQVRVVASLNIWHKISDFDFNVAHNEKKL